MTAQPAERTCNEAVYPISQGDAVFRCELPHMHDGDHLHEDAAQATDREAEVVVTVRWPNGR